MEEKQDGQVLVGTSYRLVRRIGEGSTSDVYEAIGPRGEVRAVKLLRPERARSGDARARLRLEARALAALDHPHVVRIENSGVTADGRHFLVMPLLPGETLRARLDARGPLPAGVAGELAGQMLSALSAAHRAGIVHRDVKPANVFLARNAVRSAALGRSRCERWTSAHPSDLGRVVLLDFGIAKVTWGGALTTGDHVVGTPRYLAPEQILGGRIDARTDIYSLGLVLFEAIAGRSPFPDPDPIALMRAHLRTIPPRLRAVAGASPALDEVVARAIEKAPGLRWQTANEMAEALAAARLGVLPELGSVRRAARRLARAGAR